MTRTLLLRARAKANLALGQRELWDRGLLGASLLLGCGTGILIRLALTVTSLGGIGCSCGCGCGCGSERR
jgi:hypothetical protein